MHTSTTVMGLAPGSWTQGRIYAAGGMYEAILRCDLSLDLRSVQSMVPAQLPADVRGFAGRSVELERLDRLLGEQPTAVDYDQAMA